MKLLCWCKSFWSRSDILGDVNKGKSTVLSEGGALKTDRQGVASFCLYLGGICTLLELTRQPLLSLAHSSKAPVLLWLRRFIHHGREVENYPRFMNADHDGKALAAATWHLNRECERKLEMRITGNWNNRVGEGLGDKWNMGWSTIFICIKKSDWEIQFVTYSHIYFVVFYAATRNNFFWLFIVVLQVNGAFMWGIVFQWPNKNMT